MVATYENNNVIAFNTFEAYTFEWVYVVCITRITYLFIRLFG